MIPYSIIWIGSFDTVILLTNLSPALLTNPPHVHAVPSATLETSVPGAWLVALIWVPNKVLGGRRIISTRALCDSLQSGKIEAHSLADLSTSENGMNASPARYVLE